MLTLLAQRLVATVAVMAIVGLTVFLLVHLAPGDPASVIAGDNATPDQTELSEVKWFTKAEARELLAGKYPGCAAPGSMAIAHQLIKAWAEG